MKWWIFCYYGRHGCLNWVNDPANWWNATLKWWRFHYHARHGCMSSEWPHWWVILPIVGMQHQNGGDSITMQGMVVWEMSDLTGWWNATQSCVIYILDMYNLDQTFHVFVIQHQWLWILYCHARHGWVSDHNNCRNSIPKWYRLCCYAW